MDPPAGTKIKIEWVKGKPRCGQCSADDPTLFCSRCQDQYYCSAKCQSDHWPTHKPSCLTLEQQVQKDKLGEMLVKASLKGQLRLVQELVEKRGVNVNFFCSQGTTALHAACQEGHLELVDWLIAAGARVNQGHIVGGATPLIIASQYGFIEVVQSLLRAGAKVDLTATDQLGNTPLIQASTFGQPLVVDALLQAGARVSFVRKDGVTALYMACQKGDLECVRLLIRAGADVDQANTDEIHDSPLIKASVKNHVHVVIALIAAGCNVNYIRPIDGTTALIQASQYYCTDVVRTLLISGANPRIANHYGYTALYLAKTCEYAEIIALLEARLAELERGLT